MEYLINLMAMTRIKDFLAKIKRKPSYMNKVDWSLETGKFGYQRIKSIIIGLEDDDQCLMARDYIIEAWCFITKREPDEIVARLNSCLKDRKEAIRQQLSKQAFQERTQSPEWKALYDNAVCESYCHLQVENEVLRTKLNEYESNSQNSFYQAKMEGIRSFIEQLIINAEGEEKKIAREIRVALTTKLSNGYIGKDFLTQEYQQRLDALGRETPMSTDLNFEKTVGTVVAHADSVIIKRDSHE